MMVLLKFDWRELVALKRKNTLPVPGNSTFGTNAEVGPAHHQAELRIEASLEAIFISPGHDYWTQEGAGRMTHGIQSVSQAECVAGRGIRGDRYFEKRLNHKGQVTFIDAVVVDELRRQFKLPQLPASILRRNLVVRGATLASLLGKTFLFQGVLFEGAQECTPCQWMDRVIAPGAKNFLADHFRGGLRAKILTNGLIRVTNSSTSG